MTRDEIIKLVEDNGLTLHGDIEHFAALVAKHTLANIDPSSFMTWQEGYEVGKQTEREACAKLCDEHCGWTPRMIGETIRARGNHDTR
jgi:hypothetical protein